MRHNQHGFSLVELAITIVVIGILLGLVVGGAAMMKNAAISSTMTQLNAIETAMTEFRKNYMSWPGDFPQATTRLTNCIAAIGCANGDGNGAIGAVGNANPDANAAMLDNLETVYAWKHLALSGLLDGYSYASGQDAWGDSHPRAAIGGGFEIFYDTDYGVSNWRGHVLRISGVLSDDDLSDDDGIDAYSARNLDEKLDDGDPLRGRISAASLTNGECIDDGEYLDEKSTFNSKDCLLFIRLDK